MPTLIPDTRVFTNLFILYDFDYPARSIIIRQRSYNQSLPFPTPVTPLLEARVIVPPTNTTVPLAKDFEDRHVDACFNNPQTNLGVSTRRVTIPYRPTDPSHNRHIAEIYSFPGVLGAEYQGETYDKDTIRIVQTNR